MISLQGDDEIDQTVVLTKKEPRQLPAVARESNDERRRRLLATTGGGGSRDHEGLSAPPKQPKGAFGMQPTVKKTTMHDA
jgi:hypothetical protein